MLCNIFSKQGISKIQKHSTSEVDIDIGAGQGQKMYIHDGGNKLMYKVDKAFEQNRLQTHENLNILKKPMMKNPK